MNNLVFFTENNEVRTELQECSPVVNSGDPKLKCFNVDEKPVYLRIWYQDDIADFELLNVYDRLIIHRLIEVDIAVPEMVKEDFEYNHGSMKGSSFEVKCYDFKEAFMCANDIMELFKEPGFCGRNATRVSVMLSDEPSKEFIQQMKHKEDNQREKHT